MRARGRRTGVGRELVLAPRPRAWGEAQRQTEKRRNRRGRAGQRLGDGAGLSRKNNPIELELGRIGKVYRAGGRSVGKTALLGLGLGAGAVAAVGAGVAAGGTHESGEAGLPVLVFGAGGAIVGALTGLVTGLSNRKRVLVYESE